VATNSSSAWTVAGFAAALDLALVVAAFGLVSLFADAEPIADPAAGVAVLALLVLLGFALTRGMRPWSIAGLAILVGWAAGVAAATVAYAVSTGTLLAALIFALSFMTVGFGVIIVIAGAIVALLAAVTFRAQQGGVDRPRWPWERDDEQ
jgi:hypothetical protein